MQRWKVLSFIMAAKCHLINLNTSSEVNSWFYFSEEAAFLAAAAVLLKNGFM
jgi:hypothetical protein